jgi:hypothetical protein
MLSFKRSGWLQEYLMAQTVLTPPNAPFAFPLTITSNFLPHQFWREFSSYQHSLELFLDNFPVSCLLLGPPGCGKSFALRSHVGRLAGDFLREIEEDPKVANSAAVPIFVDLKMYDGLLESLFPPQITSTRLKSLIKSGRATFLVDSFNEAPRKHVETGRLQDDLLGWMKRSPRCRWVVASRGRGGFEEYAGPRIDIKDMEERYVAGILQENRIDLGQRHATDLFEILRRPIFLSALLAKRMKLKPGGTHPAAALESVIRSYSSELRGILGVNLDLLDSLGSLAVGTVNTGQEMMTIKALHKAFQSQCVPRSDPKEFADVVIKGLLQIGFLVAYDDVNVSLCHQSMTEVIAARQVAQDVAQNPKALEEILRQRQWDFALSLIMHYLDEKATDKAFERIVTLDLPLAIKCARFAEHGRSQLVSQIIKSFPCVPNLKESLGFDLPELIRSLPVDTTHAPLLRELIASGDGRAPFAAELLVMAIGEAAVEPLLKRVCEHPEDDEFGFHTGQALSGLVTKDELAGLLRQFCTATGGIEDRTRFNGARVVLKYILENIDPPAVARAYSLLDAPTPAVKAAIHSWAEECGDPAGWEILIRTYLAGQTDLQFSIHMLLNRAPEVGELFTSLTEKEIQRVISHIDECLATDSNAEYSLAFAFQLEERHPAVKKYLKQLAKESKGAVLVALLANRGQKCRKAMWHEMENLFADAGRQFTLAECSLISSIAKLDWKGHEDLYLRIINRKNLQLVDSLVVYNFGGDNVELPTPLPWDWLKDMLPFALEQSKYKGHGVCRFPGFVMDNIDEDARRCLVQEFNRSDSPYRELLAEDYLDRVRTLIAHDFTEESIEFLINRLHGIKLDPDYSNILSSIADHSLALKLKLRLADNSEPFHSNIRKVLNQVGKRLKKRYV